MNAAVVHAFDAPPRYSPFADPVPADGEALVTVTAAALHPIVKALARGTHYGSTGTLPFVPGVDGVGRLQTPLGQIPAGTRVYFGATRPHRHQPPALRPQDRPPARHRIPLERSRTSHPPRLPTLT